MRDSLRKRLQEGRTIKNSTVATELLNNGKLAGRLGGKKFIPAWLREQGDVFKNLVDRTLQLLDPNDLNIASDELIQFLIKASINGSEKWTEVVSQAPDTLILLAKAFATQWFVKTPKYVDKCNELITEPVFNLKAWHDLEKLIQDEFEARAAKKGKLTTKTAGESNSLYDTLYDDGTWKLFRPKTFEGDIALASHIKAFDSGLRKTRWCTASQEYLFESYSREGNGYYVIQKWINGEYVEAWQAAFNKKDHCEFMDKRDRRQYLDVVQNAPEQLLEKIVCDHPESAFKGISLKVLWDTTLTMGFNDIDQLLKQTELILADEAAKQIFNVKNGFLLTKTNEVAGFTQSLIGAETLITPDEITTVPHLPEVIKGNLKTIQLSRNLTQLPARFAEGCTKLESIQIPASITQIGEEAFKDSGLISITFDSDSPITELAQGLFEDCESLVEVNLPTNLKRIASNTFSGCSSLESVILPNSLETIAANAFEDAGLTEISIPDSVQRIGATAFIDCVNLTSVRLPDSLSKAGVGIFMGCENLVHVENIDVLDGVKRSFFGCDKLVS